MSDDDLEIVALTTDTYTWHPQHGWTYTHEDHLTGEIAVESSIDEDLRSLEPME